MKKILRILILAVAALSAQAMETEPVPPPLVAGFADGNGQIGIFAGAQGGVDGVHLATGKKIWTSREGKAPVHSTFGWVAVVAPAAGPALRLRFLRPGDGKAFGKPALVHLPKWVVLGGETSIDQNGSGFFSNGISVSLFGGSPLPSRNPDGEPRSGWLRLQWKAKKTPSGGARPPPDAFLNDSGWVLVDPATGTVEKSASGNIEAPQPALATLLPDWKPEKGVRYFNWTEHGSWWTDRPRPFRIGGGVLGYVAYEENTSRLVLHRWRPAEPLSPLEIFRGGEQGVFISKEGGHLVLIEGNAGEEIFRLVDLRKGGLVQPLPRLEGKYRFPVSVMGRRLYYVKEKRMESSEMRTEIKREMVAVDLDSRRKMWAHALASRFEYGPYPGAREPGAP